MAGGHADASRRRPCRAPRGMWGGAGRWRAHGNSGTLVTVGDGNAMKTKGSSPIQPQQTQIFSPCGTMFPHGFTLQATWTRGQRRISPRTTTIAWTRVHAIINQARAFKTHVSEMIKGSPCDTWKTLERWTLIERIASRSRSSS